MVAEWLSAPGFFAPQTTTRRIFIFVRYLRDHEIYSLRGSAPAYTVTLWYNAAPELWCVQVIQMREKRRGASWPNRAESSRIDWEPNDCLRSAKDCAA